MFSTLVTPSFLLLALSSVVSAAPQVGQVIEESSAYPSSQATTTPPTLPTVEVATQVTSTTSTTGTPLGAVNTVVLAPSIPALPPGPNASSYPRNGQLNAPQPAPYVPSGGLGLNGSEPNYQVKSDFDFFSLALALYQEYIELDLFNYVLTRFTPEEFEAAGLNADDRALIRFMAEQEVGHAQVISNMLGPRAPKPCSYTYPFKTVREFVDFAQRSTRFGEAGVYGFLEHLDSRESATILLQTVTTEARQQLIFRQFEGLFPMAEFFQVGTPQSWHWTLLAPYIASCPPDQTRLVWQNFPALSVLNNPNPSRRDPSRTGFGETLSNFLQEEACGTDCAPAIAQVRPAPLSFPGREVFLAWENPGKQVGPDQSYITNTTAGAPLFVAWVTQLNVTYTSLINSGNNTGKTVQPDVSGIVGDPAINGTIFIALTDTDLTVTPFNISQINPHVVAGPAIYQAG